MVLEKNNRKTDQFHGEGGRGARNRVNTGVPRFVVLHFIARPRCCIFFFYKLKVKPPPAKRRRLALSGYSLYYGVLKQPTVSLRYACVFDE